MTLLRRIERHLQEHNVSATRFGRDVLNDSRLVFDLRNGRELRDSNQRRVKEYLDAAERKAPPR